MQVRGAFPCQRWPEGRGPPRAAAARSEILSRTRGGSAARGASGLGYFTVLLRVLLVQSRQSPTYEQQRSRIYYRASFHVFNWTSVCVCAHESCLVCWCPGARGAGGESGVGLVLKRVRASRCHSSRPPPTPIPLGPRSRRLTAPSTSLPLPRSCGMMCALWAGTGALRLRACRCPLARSLARSLALSFGLRSLGQVVLVVARDELLLGDRHQPQHADARHREHARRPAKEGKGR